MRRAMVIRRAILLKRAIHLASVSTGLAVAVACASSKDEEGAPLPDAADGPEPTLDGGAPEDSVSPIRDASTCSEAGWCITALPDRGLILKDIWPLEHRAFAIAEHGALGVKILEWEDALQAWNYIDDNSQNEYGLANFAGKIWAPSEGEIYYTVAPDLVYHGRRTARSAPWSWERDELADHSRDTIPAHDHGLAYADPNPDRNCRRCGTAKFPALGVWGTSADDVYAWFANTIFHRKSMDGGPPAWIAELVLDDPDAQLDTTYVFGANGPSRDEIWFSSGRVRYEARTDRIRSFGCPIVIRKTVEGYQRVIDSVINGNSCDPKPGTLSFYVSSYLNIPGRFDAGLYYRPWTDEAWLTSIAPAGANAAIGLVNGNALAYVTLEDGGLARHNSIGVRVPSYDIHPVTLNSVWLHGANVWASGWGIVLRLDKNPLGWSTGQGIVKGPAKTFADGGTYDISTVVINNVALDTALYQVRGTSNTNVWAIGEQYALHKTTP